MAVLTIDTALAACTVGIVADAGVLAQARVLGERGQAERLIPQVRDVLAAAGRPGGAGIAGLVVTIGPGSFTGLRVGLAAARALGLAWSVPVHGITTLAAVAHAARGHGAGAVAVLHHVGRGGIAGQRFDAQGTAEGAPILADRDSWIATLRYWHSQQQHGLADAVLAGTAAADLAPLTDLRMCAQAVWPDPAAMAAHAAATAGAGMSLAPLYLSAA